jgi:TldD protein
MTQTLALAQSRLWAPAELAAHDLDRVFARLMSPGVDSADLYFQHSRSESWMLEDGIVKEGSHSIEQGVGVRAQSGEKTGFAYSDDIVMPALLEAAGSARAIAREGAAGCGKALAVTSARRALYPALDPIDSMVERSQGAPAQRNRCLCALAGFACARRSSSASRPPSIRCWSRASDGTLAADVRPLVRFNVQVIAEQNGRRESGLAVVVDATIWYDCSRMIVRAESPARRCAQALVNLDAVDAPAGNDDRWYWDRAGPACCCTRPSATAWKATSTARAPRRFRAAWVSALLHVGVTIVDDGTLAGRRGSLSVDDEGTPSQCTVLIEDGILKGLHAGQAQCATDGHEGDRQRPARILRPPAHAAHDQYLHAGRDSEPDEICAR